jgi:hypothetical protein
LVEFNFEFLPWLQAHALGVGMANQQVAIAMDPGPKVSLTTFGPTGARRTRGEDVALGSDKSPIKAFF